MARFKEVKLLSGEKIKLSERELLFCEHYLTNADRNATEAAKMAGYSKRTATNIANQNLGKLHIQKYLDNKTKPLIEAMGITHEKLIRERASLAFTNLTDLVDNNWNLKTKDEIDPVHYPALNSVEITEKILQRPGTEDILLERKIKYRTNEKEKSLSVLEEISGLVRKKDQEVPIENKSITLFQQINNTYSS